MMPRHPDACRRERIPTASPVGAPEPEARPSTARRRA
jgi:hypothetical protein